MKQKSIGKDKAIKLYESQWWDGWDDKDIVTFQLMTAELMIPFGILMEKLNAVLGRPVFTHELADPESLYKELTKETNPPTLDEIISKLESRLNQNQQHAQP